MEKNLMRISVQFGNLVEDSLDALYLGGNNEINIFHNKNSCFIYFISLHYLSSILFRNMA